MNPVETGLAFVEGLALIASPCILPVLPLILSTAIGDSKARPFLIILGFVLSFSLLAFASRKLVAATGIDVAVIRDASLVLLFFMGAVMLSSGLSQKFSGWTKGLAALGDRIINTQNKNPLAPVITGGLIGLVWTPCAGPVLAAVLVQVIRQETDLAGYLIILSFSLGAAVPMLVISLLGRTAARNMGFLTRRTETLRKVFGVLILASVLLIASGVDLAGLGRRAETAAPSVTGLTHALETPYPAPALAPADGWINTDGLTLAGLKGKVVLVDFWTYSCINCVRTLPYLTAWDEKYHDKGLVILGVHAPEFEFEKKMDNVKAAVAAHGIRYPVVLDNSLSTWVAFKNRYWPAHYLIDRDGSVVYTHFGEGNYAVTENNIRFLLGIQGAAAENSDAAHGDRTPETYLGRARADDKFVGGDFPDTLAADHWALAGGWEMGAEHITATAVGARLRLHFRAKNVYLVMGAKGGVPVSVAVTLDGKARETITVDGHKLYTLLSLDASADGVLELEATQPGLEAYAFTFG